MLKQQQRRTRTWRIFCSQSHALARAGCRISASFWEPLLLLLLKHEHTKACRAEYGGATALQCADAWTSIRQSASGMHAFSRIVPVSKTSGPTTCQLESTKLMACVISTFPSSPTGEGALTPPICKGTNLPKALSQGPLHLKELL